MPTYTSFISNVHKSYSAEKIVSHHLVFYLSRLVVLIGSKRNFIATANIRLLYGKSLWNKIAFGTI